MVLGWNWNMQRFLSPIIPGETKLKKGSGRAPLHVETRNHDVLKTAAADLQSLFSCWEAELGGGWVTNLGSPRKMTVILTLESFGSIRPLPNTQDTHQLWSTCFQIPPPSTRSTLIPTSLSILQTCTSNSQLLIHKSMPRMCLRVTNAKTHCTCEFPVVTHHPLPQYSWIRPGTVSPKL